MEIQKYIIEDREILNKDSEKYVICQICKKRLEGTLPVHLRVVHDISTEEYLNIFPNAKLYTRKFLLHQKYAFESLLRKDPNHQSRVGKIGGHNSQETLKREKIGCFYNPEIKREAVKKIHAINKKNGFNIGKVRIEQMINDSPYIFEDKKFLSKGELGCYKIFREVFDDEDIVVNMFIGAKSIDFFIRSLSLFIEYHPKTIQGGWVITSETKEEYYQRRRQVLDESGYDNNKLLVFKNLKEAREWKESLTK